MAGHSHWKNMARHKAVVDAKRGKLFSKLSRYIIIAAKNGGGDPETNLRLRYAIDKARAVSMPRDNIEKAIKRGTGELDGASYDEIMYEGYGPGGVALMVEVATDNRNRTNGEIKNLPKTFVDVDVETGRKVLRLIDALDNNDDVQNVYTNATLTAEMADA